MLDFTRVDLWIVVLYLIAMLVVAFVVSSKSRDVEGYTVGNRSINGWILGMSVLGTYLSSITFLGLPAATYKGNWSSYVFGMAAPIAALIAVIWIVPLYRKKADRLSAYELLEERFGYWARLYADAAYTVLQMIRIGMVLLLVAFAVEPMLGEPPQALTKGAITTSGMGGMDKNIRIPRGNESPEELAEIEQHNKEYRAKNPPAILPVAKEDEANKAQANLPVTRLVCILIAVGLLVIIYDTVGGIQAVIWTDVLQVIVLTVGAGWCLVVLMSDFPSWGTFLEEIPAERLSLGGWSQWDQATGSWSLGMETALIILIYGLTENLRNYSIDQNYVQRMLTAKSDRAARISLWFGSLTYLPISAAFCLIGTGLSLYYAQGDAQLPTGMLPDQVFPYFIQTALPKAVSGMVIAGISAAAMSTVDSSLNSCSTVIFTDVLRRLNWEPKNIPEIYLLRGCTIMLGIIGTGFGAGLLMIYGTESRTLMNLWWQYAGTAGGGLFGLFLMAWLMPRIPSWSAALALVSTAPVLLWGTFCRNLDEGSAWKGWECTLHPNLVGVSATLGMLLIGGICAILIRTGTIAPNRRSSVDSVS